MAARKTASKLTGTAGTARKAATKTAARPAPKAATKTATKTAAKAAPRSGTSKKAAASSEQSASALIDQRIRDLDDWRGETLARMRALIREADPQIVEEWKWRGVPVWSHDGIVCTGESYKAVVKLTFARGASLPDPKKLFNSSLEGNTRRAIDIPEGAKVDAKAFTALVKSAVTANSATKKKR